MNAGPVLLEGFNFQPGRTILGKYRVNSLLGSGWEGEVYKVTEIKTDIPRALKVFFPHRNIRDRTLRFHAKKLQRLRHCPVVIQYLHSETFQRGGQTVSCLLSEYVEGEPLSRLLAAQPGKRFTPFEALHLLHALATGLAPIHAFKEYHGDIHDENILVQRRGIGFHVRLLDLFHWGRTDRETIRFDVIQLVRVLYDSVGGAKHYARQPEFIKSICKGMRHDLICRKFPNAGHLKLYLESFEWPPRG